MVEHVLAKQQHNAYMRKSFKSVDSILNGDEDPDFFDENFKSVLSNVRCNQPFKSPSYCNMKNFQLDYLLACFLDKDDNPFPTNDKWFRIQMMGLLSLHSVGALSRPKVHAHGTSIEKIFCPHCGYHSNNPNMPACSAPTRGATVSPTSLMPWLSTGNLIIRTVRETKLRRRPRSRRSVVQFCSIVVFMFEKTFQSDLSVQAAASSKQLFQCYRLSRIVLVFLPLYCVRSHVVLAF